MIPTWGCCRSNNRIVAASFIGFGSIPEFPKSGYYPHTMPIQLLLLFCVVIWGWTFVATKICLAYLHPIELIGLRFGIGLPLLLAIISAQRRRMEFSRREYATLALGAAIIALHFIIQVIGLRY